MADVSLIITPDPDDPDCAAIEVDGSIDGRSYRFLLDTGASRSQIIADDYTATFAPIGRHDSSGVFAPSSKAVVRLPDLSLGPIRCRPFEVSRLDPGHSSPQNLLGMDVLKSYCCHFLFEQQRLSIDHATAPAQPLAAGALHLDEGAHPYVDAWLPDAQASAVWDTGSGITVVDQRFLASHAEHFELCGTSPGTDSTGATMEASLYQVGSLAIGGVRFAPHRVASVDLSAANATISRPMDMILGWTTLSQVDWVLDFPGRHWAITERHVQVHR